MPQDKAFQLVWRGGAYTEMLVAACKRGIDEAMAIGVKDAMANVPVATGTLQGSIRFEPAFSDGHDVVGEWGSYDVGYALAVEMGDRSLIPPGLRQSGPRVPTKKNEGATGFLREGQDKATGAVMGRIERHMPKGRR